MRRHPLIKGVKTAIKITARKYALNALMLIYFLIFFLNIFFVSDQFGRMKRKHTNMVVYALQKKHQRIKQITNLLLTVLYSILYDSRSRLM